jgi:hypothetical protein
MSESETPTYLAMEFEIDTRFSMICVWRVVVNVFFVFLNIALIVAAVAESDSAYLLLIACMFGDIGCCVVCSTLLVAAARTGGAARMYTTLPNPHKLPTLRHYALCSHSGPLPVWYTVTFAQVLVGGIVLLIASLIAVTTTGADYPIVAVFVGAKLGEWLIRYLQMQSFYAVAVLGSVRKILSTEVKRNRYAASRADAIRQRLLFVNAPGDGKPSAKKEKKKRIAATEPDPSRKVSVD